MILSYFVSTLVNLGLVGALYAWMTHTTLGEVAKLFLFEELLKFLNVGFMKTRGEYLYEVSYYRGPQKYTFLFPRKMQRHAVLSVSYQGEDVSSYVLPIMGPFYDFHGIGTSPRMLGYDELMFTTPTGKMFTYYNHDLITMLDSNLQTISVLGN